ncbi:unnamed protein product [Prunus armeniaca]
MPQTPEEGSSNQAGPSGSMEVAVASASEGLEVQVDVPLLKRNTLIETTASFVGANDVGQVGICTEFMKLYSISRQQGNFRWVQANCRKAKERGSVKWGPISKENEDEVERGSTKVVVTIDEAEKNMRLKASRTKKAEKEGGKHATRKRSRDNDEGLVVEALVGKMKALEEAHQSVMGTGPRLLPFNLLAPPKLPFGMEEVFAEGMKMVDFGRVTPRPWRGCRPPSLQSEHRRRSLRLPISYTELHSDPKTSETVLCSRVHPYGSSMW